MSNKNLDVAELYVKPRMEIIDMPNDYILTTSCPLDGADNDEGGMTCGGEF
jgi:hypothetical protein